MISCELYDIFNNAYFVELSHGKAFGKIVFLIRSCRSSQRRASIKKGILKNFVKLTPYQSLFFNKVADLRPACNFVEKGSVAQVFSCEFCKILRTPLLQNTWRLLLFKRLTSRYFCLLHGSAFHRWVLCHS